MENNGRLRDLFAFQIKTDDMVANALNSSLGGGDAGLQLAADRGYAVARELNKIAPHLGFEIVDITLSIRDPLLGDGTGDRVYTEDERLLLGMGTRVVPVPVGHAVIFPDGSKMTAFPSEDLAGMCQRDECTACVKAAYAFNPDARYRMARSAKEREDLEPVDTRGPNGARNGAKNRHHVDPLKYLRRPVPGSYEYLVFFDLVGSSVDDATVSPDNTA